MKAVANSSVLIALSTIGQLELLCRRFPEGVIIPKAVFREVVEQGRGRPGAEEIRKAQWLTVVPVEDERLVSLLSRELDEGEAEAIVLGRERQAGVVLLDEKEGRKAARRLGLKVLGTVGLLIWARRAGLIPTLRDQLATLQTRGMFRLDPALVSNALRIVGESE